MSMAPGSTVSCGLEGSACHPQRPAVPPAIWSPGLRNPREEARSSGPGQRPTHGAELGATMRFSFLASDSASVCYVWGVGRPS